jgi:hypothetical protein
MKQEDLALCTREEFEQELNRLCPCSVDSMNPGEFDAAFEERVRTRREVKWLRIEALLDGKLTVDQVVDQEHEDGGDEDLDLDGIHRGILEKALEQLKEGKDREDIIDETVDALELL